MYITTIKIVHGRKSAIFEFDQVDNFSGHRPIAYFPETANLCDFFYRNDLDIW